MERVIFIRLPSSASVAYSDLSLAYSDLSLAYSDLSLARPVSPLIYLELRTSDGHDSCKYYAFPRDKYRSLGCVIFAKHLNARISATDRDIGIKQKRNSMVWFPSYSEWVFRFFFFTISYVFLCMKRWSSFKAHRNIIWFDIYKNMIYFLYWTSAV